MIILRKSILVYGIANSIQWYINSELLKKIVFVSEPKYWTFFLKKKHPLLAHSTAGNRGWKRAVRCIARLITGGCEQATQAHIFGLN